MDGLGTFRRHPVRLAVAALVLLGGLPIAVALTSLPAGATHFRANQINWHTTGVPGEVEFHVTGSWRMSAYSYESSPGSGDWHSTAVVGDVFRPTSVSFGDGSGDSSHWTVTAVDVANDVVSAEAHLPHAYAGDGPWIASIDSCCRISAPTHRNNPDGYIRVESLVNPAGTSSSAVSQISPIVDCGIDALCVFQVPATDADGQARSFRFATSAEAGSGFTQPVGATIDGTSGQYSWDTTGASLNTGGDSFFSTQVIVENVVGSEIVATTPVDFFIRVTDSPNRAPSFVSPTPADATIFDVTTGDPVTFDIAATDPDSTDTVSLTILGMPSDATFTPTAGNPASGTFTWPAATGDQILTLLAQDQLGLGALQRSVTIVVEGPPRFVAPTPEDGAEFEILATQRLDFTVTAEDPDGDTVHLATLDRPPNTSYTYVGAPGNPSTAVFSWTPGVVAEHLVVLTTFDEDGNVGLTRAVTLRSVQAPVTLTVNPAVAELSTEPVTVTGDGVVNNDVYALFASAYIQAGPDDPVPGAGIPDKLVRFFAGSTFLCEGVSQDDGLAFCRGDLPSRHLETALNGGYSATFAGDSTYAPAEGHGTVLQGP